MTAGTRPGWALVIAVTTTSAALAFGLTFLVQDVTCSRYPDTFLLGGGCAMDTVTLALVVGGGVGLVSLVVLGLGLRARDH